MDLPMMPTPMNAILFMLFLLYIFILYIYSYGLDKFVRFAKQVWGVSEEGKTKDEVAQEGISCLESFIKELGIVTSISELGATREMLPLIANSTVLGGAYKKLTAEEVLKILENCF